MPLSDTLLDLLGPFPDRAPLEPSIPESLDCGTFTRHRVEYNVEEGERISAYVLVPNDGAGSYPAVFCHHQHGGRYDLGKSEVVGLAGDASQAIARELVDRGFITFAPDAVAFEERNWSDGTGQAAYYELASRLVQGKTLLAKVLHDVLVGLDYLESRSDVDSSRIGFIGHSYGGRMAIWSAAFDDRIKASVSHCGCVGYRDCLRRDAGIQLEFCVPGIMQWGDIEDVVRMIAPRALLLSATSDDQWSAGAEEMYVAARSDFPDGALELAMYPGGHVLTKEMRERSYAFLEKHLQPENRT